MPDSLPPSEKQPVSQLGLYGLGNMASLTAGYGIGSLANYVFNLGLGVNPALVGLAQAVPRLLDLITDPLAGYVSDALKPRYGRKLLIALGTVISSVFFAAVWLFPAGLSTGGYFLWLMTFSCLTYVGWSLLSVPWQALGFELTSSPNERTRLMAAATFFGGLAGIEYGWSYAATQMPLFRDTVHGARWVGGAMALMILITGLACAWGCREPRETAPVTGAPLAAPHGSARDFFRAFICVMRNPGFRTLMGAVVAMCLGVFCISSFGPYLVIYYVKPGDATGAAWLIGAASTAWQGTSLALAAVVSWTANRFGKHRALQYFLGVALAGNLAKWFCYSPTHPWLYVISSMCLLRALPRFGRWRPRSPRTSARMRRAAREPTREGCSLGCMCG